MKYELFIGWRYLRTKKKERFVSVISLISISGVALGVMSLIVVISVMNGFDRDLRERILGTKSHLVISDFYGMPRYEEIAREVEKDPSVQAAAPSIIGQGMIKYKNSALGVVSKGLVPEQENRVTKLDEILIAGSTESMQREIPKTSGAVGAATPADLVDIHSLKPTYDGIILGKEVARSLFGIPNLSDNKEREKAMFKSVVGTKVKFISFVEENTPAGRVPRTETLEIAGVFDSGLYDYDMTLVYMSLPTAQRLYDMPDSAMQIEMKLVDLNKVDLAVESLEQRLEQRFGEFFSFTTWKQMNSVFFRALQIEKLAMFIILVLIVLVAAFNIASTLIMVVMEKTKDIGILMSMGAKRRSIMRIFMIEGGVVATLGTFFGSAVGIAVCQFLKVYKINMPGGGGVYYIDTLPVQMLPSDIAIIIGTTIIVCLLAAIYPAWQASRLIPTEALRYE